MYTPQNIKRGSPQLIVKWPAELRYNHEARIRVLIAGSDSRFTHGTYVLRFSVGPSVGKFEINPRVLRYYDVKIPGRDNFPAWSGSMSATTAQVAVDARSTRLGSVIRRQAGKSCRPSNADSMSRVIRTEMTSSMRSSSSRGARDDLFDSGT